MSEHREWGFYFPDDGEDASDAVPIIGKVWDADYAAELACEYDYSSRDGWERGDREFAIVVVNPDGEEFRYIGWNEPTVNHCARAAET